MQALSLSHNLFKPTALSKRNIFAVTFGKNCKQQAFIITHSEWLDGLQVHVQYVGRLQPGNRRQGSAVTSDTVSEPREIERGRQTEREREREGGREETGGVTTQ